MVSKLKFLLLCFVVVISSSCLAGGPEGVVGISIGGTGATTAAGASANILGTSIKVKKLTGTTSGSVGGSATVAHGLNAAKIVAYCVMVNDGTNLILPFFRSGTNIVFDAYIDATNVNVDLRAADSSSLTSKAFTAIIWYQD